MAGYLRYARGVNETISSLLLTYIGIAIMNFFVEGMMRDASNPNKPSTKPIGDAYMVGKIPGTDVHWGFAVGVLLSIALYFLMTRTTFGFAARVTGGNFRAALAQGLPVGKLIVACAMIAGGCAGLAGFFEVAAIQGRANASLAAGYGFTGILVSFLARHNPLVIVPIAILFGGLVASGGLIQRRMELPDATVLVLAGPDLRGAATSETRMAASPSSIRKRERTGHERRARHRPHRHAGRRDPRVDPLHVRRARRMPRPRIGPVDLGQEGALVLGAMIATPRPFTPVRHGSASRSGRRRLVLGAMHGYLRAAQVNDVAVGIAMMLFGTGVAFFFGKPYIQPTAPRLPSLPFAAGAAASTSEARSTSTRCSSSESPSPILMRLGAAQHPWVWSCAPSR